MTEPPLIASLPDGRRLHCRHGPIELVIEAWGDARSVQRGYRRVAARFPKVLPELAAELALLRRPISAGAGVSSPIARAMAAACRPYADVFITPMAAVAGAVADAMLACLAGTGITRAYVNNGGDIAFHLDPGERLTAGLVADIAAGTLYGSIPIAAESGVRGLATSGWGGRSFSLGIADAVTILAADAASADAAATIVANAVDVADPVIERRPARVLQADSDLGDLPVTVRVGRLSAAKLDRALDAGAAVAEDLVARGLIAAAVLVAQGRHRTVGALAGTPALLEEG